MADRWDIPEPEPEPQPERYGELEHDHDHDHDQDHFFQDYDAEREIQLLVNARIGGYEASIFGSWTPKEVGGCSTCGRGNVKFTPKYEGEPVHSCRHPFTLYPAAASIAYLLKCRNLRDIEFWKVAEKEWQKQEEIFGKRVEAREGIKGRLISEIYQLVGLAAAFQGLLITAAAQLSIQNNTCGKRLWSLLALSVFATAVTVLGVSNKVKLVYLLQKSIRVSKPSLGEYERFLGLLKVRRGPGGFDLCPEDESSSKRDLIEEFLKKIHSSLNYATLVLLSLVAFGAICGLALRFIIC